MRNSTKNINIRAVRLWNGLCPGYFPLMVGKVFFSSFTPYFNICLSAKMVNEISGGRRARTLAILAVVTIAGNLLITVLKGLLDREYGDKAVLLEQREAALFHHKALALDYEDMENPAVRQLRRKITESACIDNHGRQSLLNSLEEIVYQAINLVMALCLFMEMFFFIAVNGFDFIAIALLLLLTILGILNIRAAVFESAEMAELADRASQTMIEENRIDDAIESYNMGKDVRIYRQDRMIEKVNMYCLELHKKAFRILYGEKFYLQIPEKILSYLMRIVMYIFVCIYALKGVFGPGSIIKYAGIIQRMTEAAVALFYLGGRVKYNAPFIEEYFQFLDIRAKEEQTCSGVKSGHECKHINAEYSSGYTIEFCNVSFRYSRAETYALRHVSLVFEHGKRIAVAGMNGAGKSTLIKLICRLYEPTEGVILLNGTDIRLYDYDEYISLISVVFQDFKLFSFSLGQNVAAQMDYNRKDVEKCLNESGFMKKVEIFSDGLDTYLYKDFDKNGVEISGGEAQKIALARALYKDAPIVLLDEPTAALDPVAEHDIYSRFDRISRGKTAIYISHRLSSCRFCDGIAVFHKGCLVQYGSHEELVKDTNGKYYEMWEAQAGYYC